MSELLPTVQAGEVRRSLLDYLTTTFALGDEDARAELQSFLEDPHDGLFKGPYVRLRLPFRAAAQGWRDAFDWYGGFPPYGHQAAAFARLSTRSLPAGQRPAPTLVTTGTGSGKTESFLYPILDHVLRAKRAGVTGTKAVVLYPMNALANDQANRLTRLLTDDPALAGVTAALYTGQQGPERTSVTSAGLITDRHVIRSEPPDVLLTNYKMLDQLLLRAEDAPLWERSATSLQYLVLDEFHTYDGAQGTDVAMLLRRLGLALKSHWAGDEPHVTDEDRRRPLGRVTPVATSATLGDGGDPARMLDFAETVFGEPFDQDAVITESRLTVAEWTDGAAGTVDAAGYDAVDVDLPTLQVVAHAVADLGDRPAGADLAAAVLGALWRSRGAGHPVTPDQVAVLLPDLVRAHPVTQWLLERTADAVAVRDLAADLLDDTGAPLGTTERRLAAGFVTGLLATVSHLRATHDRSIPSVDLHLWVRELTRIDRAVTDRPRYAWADDGPVVAHQPADDVTDVGPALHLPALYCRHCGRSGWGFVLAPTGSDLDADDTTIRRRRAADDERFRAAIHAPREGGAEQVDATVDGLRWLSVQERRLVTGATVSEAQVRQGDALPVLVHTGDDAGERSLDDTCPSCLQKDGIRFLGSAIATLLSVTVSTLFGDEGLDPGEKKALVFTDSVQDAAHRAGFVQSRSHSLTFRSVVRDAVDDATLSLEELVEEMVRAAGDDPHRRYRLVPPSHVDLDEFAPFWQEDTQRRVPHAVRKRVRQRLLLDVELEFGLNSRTGRTLERTGSVSARVDATEALMLRAADLTLEEAGGTGTLPLGSPTTAQKVAWVCGVLERMRERGALQHTWFDRYQREDGRRYSIWGGRPRSDGMPAFHAQRPAPGYPRAGGARLDRDVDLDAVTAPQSWYARWAGRNLGVAPADGGRLAKLLLDRLVHLGVLDVTTSESGAHVYQVRPSTVLVAPVTDDDLAAGRASLVCGVCRSSVPTHPTVNAQLDGAPCLVARCTGTLGRQARETGFYRRLYASADIRRVVAREHTSMLDDVVRLGYEEAFKGAGHDPQAPNVLVATPTLEMGIDIGDLSTVMLASLPRTVASYLQRVGRAGRLTGNSLNLAFVTGRGDQLPRLGQPLSVVNGAVVAPATYLGAEEILRRQFTAHLADQLARDPGAPHPWRARQAIQSVETGSYLRALLDLVDTNPRRQVAAFAAGFPTRSDDVQRSLEEWVTSPDGTPDGSGLARRLLRASLHWNHEVESLQHRRREIEASLPALEQAVAVEATATDADKRALRTAKASHRLVRLQLLDLRGGYWIAVLEERGLLPNYTLVSDSVTLDVTLTWTDPDTGEYRHDPLSYRRGGAQALRDFAPGATFYAGGHRITVDALDLGRDGDAVHEWVLCPACGYAAGPDPAATTACPRCGSTGLSDTRQRLQVVELDRVSSAMRRDDAVISDDRDERTREQFTVVTAADVDPAKVVHRWFVLGHPFGVKYLRDQTIRWLNLGRSAGYAPGRTLSGADVAAPLFRVCEECGQLDQDARANRPEEHRPWCPHRKAATEHNRVVALSRTLQTEGLVLRLPPSVTLGDAFAIPSLGTALLFGLGLRMGGSPDHIQVTETVDPVLSDGGDNVPALLLHDTVPGGTGYLADLARPEVVWDLLRQTWEALRDCPCQDEDRLACHRCLLPFAAPHQVPWVARAAAERHLRDLLLAGRDVEPDEAQPWTWGRDDPGTGDPESTLEQRFRKVLLERLEALGATVRQEPTATGNRYLITLRGGRTWRLEPQQITAGSKPDFLLRCNQPGIPEVAVFTDGWRWHASPAQNRVADDAEKRQALRDSGRIVLGVTWQDLQEAESASVPPPTWWAQAPVDDLVEAAGGQLTRASLDLVTGGPFDFLASWIQAPDPDAVRHLATWLPWFLHGASTPGVFSAGVVPRAADALDGTAPAAGDVDGWTWRHGPLVLTAAVNDATTGTTDVAVALDDRPDAVTRPDHRDAWRTWLRLSNLLNLRTAHTVIAARTTLDTLAPAPVAPASTPAAPLPAGWDEVYELATEQERRVVLLLGEAGIAVPDQGIETSDGIVIGLGWLDRRVAVDVSFGAGDLLELAAEGWHVVSPDVGSVREALAAGRS